MRQIRPRRRLFPYGRETKTDMNEINEKTLIEGLRSLPDFDPPRRVWNDVQRRIRPRWFKPGPTFITSLAASVVAAAILPMVLVAPSTSLVATGNASSGDLEDLAQGSVTLQQTTESEPRIVSHEDQVQVAISQRIKDINRHLETAVAADLEERRRLLKQRHDLMEAYLRVQKQRDSKLLMRASY